VSKIVTDKMKEIEERLKIRIKKGNYENFGLAELRKFDEWLASVNLTHQDHHDYFITLSERIEQIQEFKAE